MMRCSTSNLIGIGVQLGPSVTEENPAGGKGCALQKTVDGDRRFPSLGNGEDESIGLIGGGQAAGKKTGPFKGKGCWVVGTEARQETLGQDVVLADKDGISAMVGQQGRIQFVCGEEFHAQTAKACQFFSQDRSREIGFGQGRAASPRLWTVMQRVREYPFFASSQATVRLLGAEPITNTFLPRDGRRRTLPRAGTKERQRCSSLPRAMAPPKSRLRQ